MSTSRRAVNRPRRSCGHKNDDEDLAACWAQWSVRMWSRDGIRMAMDHLPCPAFPSKGGRYPQFEGAELCSAAHFRIPPFNFENRREVRAQILCNGLDTGECSIPETTRG